jgi:multidrug efflux system outer membrane protein
MKTQWLALLLTAGIVTGCAIGPNYQRPTTILPETYRGQVEASEAASLADLPWWEVFRDDKLKALIEEALQNNYDLRIAAARVEQARALAGATRAEFFPQIGYEGGAGRTKGAIQFQGFSSEATNVFIGAFSMSWELDVWGKIRRADEAAYADLFASEEFRRGVVLSLVSEVARAYFDLLELDLELDIARRTTESFQQTLTLFTQRLQMGVASKLETARAEASLASTAATIPDIERQIVAKENQISVLLGRSPAAIPRGTPLVDQTLPPATPAGLPSQLLERRPDIQQAEQTLVAANARVGVAKAGFLPTIGLTGLRGGRSDELEDIVKGSASIWTIAGGLTGPILQGGLVYENYQAAIAQWEQAKLRYEQSVLTALKEVSDALTDQQKLVEVQKEQERAVKALQESVRLATLRYTGGFASYYEVIEAQQQLFPAENALAQTRRDRLAAVVQLYKALGGGWSAYTTSPELPALWHVVLP